MAARPPAAALPATARTRCAHVLRLAWMMIVLLPSRACQTAADMHPCQLIQAEIVKSRQLFRADLVLGLERPSPPAYAGGRTGVVLAEWWAQRVRRQEDSVFARRAGVSPRVVKRPGRAEDPSAEHRSPQIASQSWLAYQCLLDLLSIALCVRVCVGGAGRWVPVLWHSRVVCSFAGLRGFDRVCVGACLFRDCLQLMSIV